MKDETEICVCGDARSSHRNDGPCAFNSYPLGGHGTGQGCYHFVAAKSSDQVRIGANDPSAESDRVEPSNPSDFAAGGEP